MSRKITLLIFFALPFFCMAQNPLAREYSYDASGNRTALAVINLPPPAPLMLLDSTETEQAINDNRDERDDLQEVADKYFVEKIAQTEIKIYPNPTTEKIVLEISNWDNLQTGIFKLYSLNGQLLQEQPVHSATTTVSLAGLAKGVYILKVHINSNTEDWKIIKN